MRTPMSLESFPLLTVPKGTRPVAEDLSRRNGATDPDLYVVATVGESSRVIAC